MALLVTTLLGHAHVETAALCLGSLRRYSARDVEFRLHDDGTLTEPDVARLAAVLGAVDVVWRSQADLRVDEILAAHPATRRFRRANPLALKLVDAVLLAPGDRTVFCDTDVLFLRPFEAPDVLAGSGVDAVFMSDAHSAYSLRSWHLLRQRRLRLLQRVNTGLYTVRRSVFDPDLVEWFAARPELHRTPVWAEQTAWSMLAARVPARLLDAEQAVVPSGARAPGPEAVAVHFVGPVRSLLQPVAAAAPDRGAEAPVRLRCRPARPCRPRHLLAAELRRRLRRGLGR